MTDGFEIKILSDLRDIEGIRKDWKKWVTAPYSDIDFFLTMIEAQKPAGKPHVILLHARGSPAAIVVAHLTESVLDFKVSHKSIFRAPLKTLTVVTGGLLGDQTIEVTKGVVGALLNSLRVSGADALVIGHTRTDSDFFQMLRKQTSFLCWDQTLEVGRHWKMAVCDTMEGVYLSLSGEHRKKLRWQNRNFEKHFQGGLRVHCFRELAEREVMVKDVEEIARRTYQRSLGSSFVDNEANRKRITLECSKGWLRMYVLYVNDKPCAYWWASLYDRTLYSEAMGFDTDYRRYSPGMYLLTKALEELCKEGVKAVDFGAGDFLYKRQFGNECWNETMVFYVFAPKLRTIYLNVLRTMFGAFRHSSRWILGRCNLLSSIRKFCRHKMVPEA